MSITAELQNVKKFESVGFNHNQAVVLSGAHETTAQDSVKELKEFIHSELNNLELRLNASISEVKGEAKASQTDFLFKIFGIIFGCSALVVAVLKLIL